MGHNANFTAPPSFILNFIIWVTMLTLLTKSYFRDLQKCDFSEISEHFKKVSEERKARSKEEKKKEKEYNDAIVEEYGFCMIDGHREKIGNFRCENTIIF